MARRSIPHPENRERSDSSHSNGSQSLDLERVDTVFQEYPTRFSVLFGSQVTDNVDSQSDIDIAVELASHDEPTTDLYMRILTDLSLALERDDIDLALVGDLRPRVGLAAFTHGELLAGSRDRMDMHRDRFERQVEQFAASEPPLDERFDAVLGGIGEIAGEKP